MDRVSGACQFVRDAAQSHCITLSDERVSGLKANSWTVKTIESNSGLYGLSKGQLMKTWSGFTAGSAVAMLRRFS
jgi:hypothetical protein